MADYRHVASAQVTPDERERIKALAGLADELFDVPTMVNIGVLAGASCWCLRAGAPSAILYGIDIDYTKWPVEDEANLRAVLITGDSTRIHAEFDKPIHLLLIDGDHHYETVVRDIAGWVPKVVEGGIVIFHDYAPTELNLRQFPHIAGVRQAVDEWYNENSDDWRELPTPNSLKVFQRERRSLHS